MKLEYIILGLLTINHLTGYDIKKFMDTEGRFGMPSRPLSQIYNTLKRMVKKGWIEFEMHSRSRKPDLKIYSITEEGKAYFVEYLESPIELVFRYRESDLSMRVLFSHLVDPSVTIKTLQSELNYRKEQISQFRNRDRAFTSSLIDPEQLEVINAVSDKMHLNGAKGIDDYVQMLESLIVFFEERQNMRN